MQKTYYDEGFYINSVNTLTNFSKDIVIPNYAITQRGDPLGIMLNSGSFVL